MAKIPLEDTVSDVIGKAQRGLKVSDADLARLSEVSEEDLEAVKAGEPKIDVIRKLARNLRLNPDRLQDMANHLWYPQVPAFPHSFAMFNTRYDDMGVNSYLVWDGKSKVGAAFDTGASADGMIDLARSERVRITHIFLTHTHEDHVADLKHLQEATGAEVWASELEPADYPGAKTFKENVHFHIGKIEIKTLATGGHSPGQTTYYMTGLSWPLAIVGDSLFASSMGGSATAYEQQYDNDVKKILSLPKDTVIAPGHGPLTTVGQERRHNPFFAR